MTTTLRHHLILLLTCGCVFFLNLGAARLFDEDEPKNAECGREMYERSDWVVPTFNYELRTDKPIMLYWLMLSSFNLLGVSEFSARLPSAIMATVTVLTVYQIGWRFFGQAVAFWSSIILSSTMMYVVSGRISTPDATLIAFITLSIFAYIRLQPVGEKGWSQPESATWPKAYLPANFSGYVLLYALMALAVLTKGPVGFLLPCSVIGLFLMCRGQAPHAPQDLSWNRPLQSANELVNYLAAFIAPSRFFPALWAMRPFTILLVVGLVALPWYITVGWMTNGAWLEGFLGGHNIGRFSSAMEGHSGPIFYYVIAILMGFFPWSVFLPVTLYLAASQRHRFEKDNQGLLFLLCWAGVYVGFFSIAQTKLPNYVLPCYPPLALLMGWTLVRWQEGSLTLPNWSYIWGARSLILSGLALIIAFPIVSYILLPGYWAVGLVGCLPIAAGCWMLTQNQLMNRKQILKGIGVCSIAFVSTVFAGITPWISQAQESSQLGLSASRLSDSSVPLATYQYFAPNLPFYAERPVLRHHSSEEVAQFWKEHPDGVLCVRDQELSQLDDVMPKDVVVVEKIDRFLRPHQIVLLKRQSTAPRTAAQPSVESVIR
ncbi:glycosyltransferase family 39 protein [uncultured Rubinisphaera sp.]|uniref:ArnT family glycosyltransferase n=1 Tax=uncultured Rubinisphaera sp. TaxID=1678686 RepID=UPI0030DCDCCC